MAENFKMNIRIKDRERIKRFWTHVEAVFIELFSSKPFCNRCYELLPLEKLEINHGIYNSYRFAELVCRPCHEKVESLNIPNLMTLVSERSYPEKFAIFVFETGKNLIWIQKRTGKKVFGCTITRPPFIKKKAKHEKPMREIQFTLPSI